MKIRVPPLKQFLSYSKPTLECVTFDQVHISDGRWYEVFGALDHDSMIKARCSDCDYCDDSEWDESDMTACNDLFEHIETRRTTRGLENLGYSSLDCGPVWCFSILDL
jgi:hypothetical protein